MSVDYNFVAIGVAALATMPLGAVWYDVIFKKPFTKLTGSEKFDKKTQNRILGVGMSVTIVGAFLLSALLWAMGQIVGSFYEISTVSASLQFGLVAWLVLLALRVLMHDTFENRPTKLTAIHMSYDLAVIAVLVIVQSLFA